MKREAIAVAAAAKDGIDAGTVRVAAFIFSDTATRVDAGPWPSQAGAASAVLDGLQVRHGPFDITPAAVKSISFGSPHVRTTPRGS